MEYKLFQIVNISSWNPQILYLKKLSKPVA